MWIFSTGTTSRQGQPWRRESRGAGLPTVRRRRQLPEQAPPVASNPPPPPARPLIPLASFFDAARRLVWPADAPTHGDFAAKKSASDAKTLELLEELERKGYARISTAADARTNAAELWPTRTSIPERHDHSAPLRCFPHFPHVALRFHRADNRAGRTLNQPGREQSVVGLAFTGPRHEPRPFPGWSVPGRCG